MSFEAKVNIKNCLSDYINIQFEGLTFAEVERYGR